MRRDKVQANRDDQRRELSTVWAEPAALAPARRRSPTQWRRRHFLCRRASVLVGNRFRRRSKPSRDRHQDGECFVIDLAHYAAFVISQFRMRATTKDDGQRLRPDTMSAAAAFLGPQWATCRSQCCCYKPVHWLLLLRSSSHRRIHSSGNEVLPKSRVLHFAE